MPPRMRLLLACVQTATNGGVMCYKPLFATADCSSSRTVSLTTYVMFHDFLCSINTVLPRVSCFILSRHVPAQVRDYVPTERYSIYVPKDTLMLTRVGEIPSLPNLIPCRFISLPYYQSSRGQPQRPSYNSSANKPALYTLSHG